MVVVEGGNVLHHVKKKGELFGEGGEISEGRICPGDCPDPSRSLRSL